MIAPRLAAAALADDPAGAILVARGDVENAVEAGVGPFEIGSNRAIDRHPPRGVVFLEGGKRFAGARDGEDIADVGLDGAGQRLGRTAMRQRVCEAAETSLTTRAEAPAP